mmetsp:Transcript_25037/g.43760  ORF Transcript_25037/g.43760 Transcript_25037/m.43760 type:complete len:582 (+) Transcript_25037:658-2403(+)
MISWSSGSFHSFIISSRTCAPGSERSSAPTVAAARPRRAGLHAGHGGALAVVEQLPAAHQVHVVVAQEAEGQLGAVRGQARVLARQGRVLQVIHKSRFPLACDVVLPAGAGPDADLRQRAVPEVRGLEGAARRLALALAGRRARALLPVTKGQGVPRVDLTGLHDQHLANFLPVAETGQLQVTVHLDGQVGPLPGLHVQPRVVPVGAHEEPDAAPAPLQAEAPAAGVQEALGVVLEGGAGVGAAPELQGEVVGHGAQPAQRGAALGLPAGRRLLRARLGEGHGGEDGLLGDLGRVQQGAPRGPAQLRLDREPGAVGEGGAVPEGLAVLVQAQVEHQVLVQAADVLVHVGLDLLGAAAAAPHPDLRQPAVKPALLVPVAHQQRLLVLGPGHPGVLGVEVPVEEEVHVLLVVVMHQRHVGPAVARERAPAGDPALLLLLGGLVPRGAGVGQAGAARGAVQPQPPLAVHVQPEVHGPAAPLALAANLLEERGGVVVVRPDPELQRAVVGVLEPQALLVRHLHVPAALEVDVPVGLRLGVPVQPEAAVRVQPRGAELEQPQAPAPGDGGGDQAPDACPPVRHHEE